MFGSFALGQAYLGLAFVLATTPAQNTHSLSATQTQSASGPTTKEHVSGWGQLIGGVYLGEGFGFDHAPAQNSDSASASQVQVAIIHRGRFAALAVTQAQSASLPPKAVSLARKAAQAQSAALSHAAAFDAVGCTVDGVDRSMNFLKYESSISQQARVPYTATLWFRDFVPTRGQFVKVFSGLPPRTFGNSRYTEFAGFLTKITQEQANANAVIRYRCDCIDWNWLLDRGLVYAAFTNLDTVPFPAGDWSDFNMVPPSSIAVSLVNSTNAGLPSSLQIQTNSYVQAFTSPVTISFSGTQPAEALTQLADQIGAVEYLDDEGALHLAVAGTEGLTNPSTLTATNTFFSALSAAMDDSDRRTRVIVEGGGGTLQVVAPPNLSTLPVFPYGNISGDYYSAGGGTVLTSDMRRLTYGSATVNSLGYPSLGWIEEPGNPTLSSVTTGGSAMPGSLTPGAAYRYGFTFVSIYGESDMKATVSFDPPGHSAVLGLGTIGSPQAWQRYTNYRVYRSKAGLGPLFFLADVTSGPYIDIAMDSQLGAAYEPGQSTTYSQMGVPPDSSMLPLFSIEGLPSAGWVQVDGQAVRYTSIISSAGVAGCLAGIPSILITSGAINSTSAISSVNLNHAALLNAGTILEIPNAYGVEPNEQIAVSSVSGTFLYFSRAVNSTAVGSAAPGVQLILISAAGSENDTCGPGAILSPIPVGTDVIALGSLNDVQGNTEVLPQGTTLKTFYQADDLSAQSSLAAQDGSDGVRVVRLPAGDVSYDQAVQMAAAELALGADPRIDLACTTYDPYAVPYRILGVSLPSSSLATSAIIQASRIYWVAGKNWPQRDIQASNRVLTLAQILARLTGAT